MCIRGRECRLVPRCEKKSAGHEATAADVSLVNSSLSNGRQKLPAGEFVGMGERGEENAKRCVCV